MLSETPCSARARRLEDGEHEGLRVRINWTLDELREVARGLRDRGYSKATEFLKRNTRFMVTFAERALERVRIQYTKNRVERMMGEISKRCKHRWMR